MLTSFLTEVFEMTRYFLWYQSICDGVHSWSMMCIVFGFQSLLIICMLPETENIKNLHLITGKLVRYILPMVMWCLKTIRLHKGNKGPAKDSYTHLDALWAGAAPSTWHAWWACKTSCSSNPCNSKWARSSLLWRIMKFRLLLMWLCFPLLICGWK